MGCQGIWGGLLRFVVCIVGLLPLLSRSTISSHSWIIRENMIACLVLWYLPSQACPFLFFVDLHFTLTPSQVDVFSEPRWQDGKYFEWTFCEQICWADYFQDKRQDWKKTLHSTWSQHRLMGMRNASWSKFLRYYAYWENCCWFCDWVRMRFSLITSEWLRIVFSK